MLKSVLRGDKLGCEKNTETDSTAVGSGSEDLDSTGSETESSPISENLIMVQKKPTQAKIKAELAQLSKKFMADGQILVLDPKDAQRLLFEDEGEMIQTIRGEIRKMYDDGQVHYTSSLPIRRAGAISYPKLQKDAPQTVAFYQNEDAAAAQTSFMRKMDGIFNAGTLFACPEFDTHSAAIYVYSRLGDFMHWHYDSSFYRGERFTILIGLENVGPKGNSSEDGCDPTDVCSSGLEYVCPVTKECKFVPIRPGQVVMFNGSIVRHRVTSLGDTPEKRVVLTLEYITDNRIFGPMRYFMNLKEDCFYFGSPRMFEIFLAVTMGILILVFGLWMAQQQ